MIELNKNKEYKLFISHKMNGLTDEEIEKVRDDALNTLMNEHPELIEYNNNIKLIDNYHCINAPENASPLWFLSRSLEQLDSADLIYFYDIPGEEPSRGCLMEAIAVSLYDLQDKVL